jgi:uncharacterized protein YdeI (YjbR/CyaY-like superfamily)
MNPLVDDIFYHAKKWQKEMLLLRNIVLDCGLFEEIKWKQPCYTFGKSNIVIIHGFKEYCALLFFKGALLHDAEGILIQQTENVQSGRQIRFTNDKEIIKLQPVLKAYIYEAIEVEKAGLKVALKKNTELILPKELLHKLNKNAALKKAFYALTPGRQRAYNLYFSAATQSKTIESRIEKYLPRILNGKGFHDCVCGLSKKMPTCDGSHKYLRTQ